MKEFAYVYILSNSFRKLYVGVTTELMIRVSQHKRRLHPDGHTAKYGIDELVYYETFTSIGAAINREKVLKGWLRIKKLELIIATNPEWKDLSSEWGKQAELYDFSKEAEREGRRQTFDSSEQTAGVLRYAQDDGVKQTTASATTAGTTTTAGTMTTAGPTTTASAITTARSKPR